MSTAKDLVAVCHNHVERICDPLLPCEECDVSTACSMMFVSVDMILEGKYYG